MRVTIEEAVNFFNQNKNWLKSSYMGRPGCGCGCKGRHIEGSRRAQDRLETAKHLLDPRVKIETYSDEIIVSFESEEKYVWFYFGIKEAA